jgi:hypothetical protein
MRILKKKVSLRPDSLECEDNLPEERELIKTEANSHHSAPHRREFLVKEETSSYIGSEFTAHSGAPGLGKEDPLRVRGPRKHRTHANADSKNIIKNYGKALCTFASSKLALPYIENVIEQKGYKGIHIRKFMEHMKHKKETTSSMDSIRRLLIEELGDTDEQKKWKDIFKELSIIFMKYFSVNWIFGGKLLHKRAHLKFRFKMLRRIQHPEFFTYLKASAKNQEVDEL